MVVQEEGDVAGEGRPRLKWPAVLHRHMKLGRYASRIAQAPQYLAAVLEYMAAEVLELAGNAAPGSRATRGCPSGAAAMRSRAPNCLHRVCRHASCYVKCHRIFTVSTGARELRGEERGGDGGGDREDARADVALGGAFRWRRRPCCRRAPSASRRTAPAPRRSKTRRPPRAPHARVHVEFEGGDEGAAASPSAGAHGGRRVGERRRRAHSPAASASSSEGEARAMESTAAWVRPRKGRGARRAASVRNVVRGAIQRRCRQPRPSARHHGSLPSAHSPPAAAKRCCFSDRQASTPRPRPSRM